MVITHAPDREWMIQTEHRVWISGDRTFIDGRPELSEQVQTSNQGRYRALGPTYLDARLSTSATSRHSASASRCKNFQP
ncbi:hypothetical protein RSOLAG1IB_02655 [Rhizoctonia solani AG-1 IB]|uniref:Uncharacterized protein n=1 Tax=Thanatephorus cucumeris (strain AG1-IB / isolate 7/3/14) TaxID=1108050 RepID=A0A0B7FIS6_THACB|nr:hypothetical protein RSOLAG1IB_02655 [Rhizoctonia solani AG-1 IB]